MGYTVHHAIIVTSWNHELLAKAHAKAVELGDKANNPGGLGDMLWQVTEITPEVTNGHRSFLVGPDGSKEGWRTSAAGDAARAELVAWLDDQRYDDDSSALSWVELSYGDDDRDVPVVLADSGKRIRERRKREKREDAVQ